MSGQWFGQWVGNTAGDWWGGTDTPPAVVLGGGGRKRKRVRNWYADYRPPERTWAVKTAEGESRTFETGIEALRASVDAAPREIKYAGVEIGREFAVLAERLRRDHQRHVDTEIAAEIAVIELFATRKARERERQIEVVIEAAERARQEDDEDAVMLLLI